MGIRQLPSGAFQARVQLDHVTHTTTFATRTEANRWLQRTRARLLQDASAHADPDTGAGRSMLNPPDATPAADDADRRAASSAAAAATIDAIFAGLDLADADSQDEELPINDPVITTGQAADLLNISRPTLIARLDAGAIPYTRAGCRRRLRLTDVLAYRDRT